MTRDEAINQTIAWLESKPKKWTYREFAEDAGSGARLPYSPLAIRWGAIGYLCKLLGANTFWSMLKIYIQVYRHLGGPNYNHLVLVNASIGPLAAAAELRKILGNKPVISRKQQPG